jgi:hypothetical protein
MVLYFERCNSGFTQAVRAKMGRHRCALVVLWDKTCITGNLNALALRFYLIFCSLTIYSVNSTSSFVHIYRVHFITIVTQRAINM